MSVSKKTFETAEKYGEIIKNPDFIKLRTIPRHTYTNTYDHSLRVARLAGLIAEKIGANRESAEKVGLLHDFCLINYYDGSYTDKEWYLFRHPKDAVKNTKKHGIELTKVEERAIISHMFPLAPMPTSRVGWAITIADKIVAVYEETAGVADAVKMLVLTGRVSKK